MKKFKGVIIVFALLIFALFPNVVFANGFTSLTGADSISSGEKIDYTISIKSNTNATAFEANLKYDNSILEIINIANQDSWNGNNSLDKTGNTTLKFTNNGITGESNVATIRFKVKDGSKTMTSISLENIKLTTSSATSDQEEDNTVLTDELKKEISIKSDDNTLKTIKIEDKPITGFSPTSYEYTIEVDSLYDKINIEATLNDSKNSSFVDEFGSRKVDLKYGNNTVLIKTKSESGKIATYTLNIIRKDDRVVNNDLSSIIINGGTVKLNFDKSVLSYIVKTFKLEKIEIEAKAEDSEAKVNIDSPKTLVIGENKAKITVTSVTGDKKEYNITIINNDTPTDTRLKNLSVKGININFNSDKYNYFIRYDKSYKKGITIYNTTVSQDVEVNILNNTNLKEGSKISVYVTALDGSSTSEYTITLEKDTRINFFFILDVVIGLILIVLIIIQLKKRNKRKKIKEEKIREMELEKTKEITL